MNEQEHVESEAVEPCRPWQFGLVHLLLLPVGLGLAMSFIIAWYPHSVMMLPVLLVVSIVAIGLSILTYPRFSSFRPAEAVIVSIVIYGVMTLLGSGLIDGPGSPRRSQCTNNLKLILLALHNYHDRYDSFPPAYVADKNGRPMHSWRVLILPFLEQQALYSRYRFDEPWDGPNNASLQGVCVPEYVCLEQDATGTPVMTSYAAVVGPGTAWPGATSARFQDLCDGTSNTAMVVEIVNSGIHWMEPRDLDAQTMTTSINAKAGLGISSLHRHSGWQRQRLGANVALADGSVVFLPTSTSETTVQALVTATGGEPIERDHTGQIRF